VSSREWLRRLGIALAIYVAAALVWLAPLVVHFGSAVLNGPTDAVLALSDYWAAGETGETPLTFDHNPYVGAPEGVPRSTAVSVANALQPLAFLGLEPVIGDVAAWNVLTIGAFFLSALAACALLLYLGFSFPTALLGGYVFGFSPWMFARALEGHAGMQHLWVLPLLFGAFLLQRRTGHLGAAAFVGALLAVGFYLHSYIGLMGIVMVTAFYGLELVAFPGRLRTLVSGTVSLLTLLVLFAPPIWLYGTDRSGASQSLSQPLSDLQKGGSTFLDYLLPSQGHPFLGWMRPDDLAREHVLFFGWTTMVGAAIGLVLVLRGRGRLIEDERAYVAVLAAVTGLLALIVSFKPVLDVAGVGVKSPSYAIGQLFTAWRAYARLGVVVGLCLVVLAAFAFEWLLRRRRGTLVAGIVAALVVVELAAGPPIPTWRTDTVPSHVEWLREHPGGIVASYPLPIEQPTLRLGAEETWHITQHGHPLFALPGGGTGGTREEAVRIVASNLADPVAGGILAAERVRYVVVHDDVYRAAGGEPPALDSSVYRLAVDPQGPTRIYTVAAAPADLDRVLLEQSSRIALARATPAPEAEYGDGFNAPERFEDGREWRWMVQGGRIEVSSAEPGRYYLVLDAFGNSVERTVTLRDANGRTLASTTVTTSRQTHMLGPFQLSAPTELALAADPGPQPLDATRSGSIFVSSFELRPAPDFKGRLNDRG
jgi:hypothetical protein